MLNDPQTHGVLVVNSNYMITIISLPNHTMDLSSGKKFLTGLLGNNCSYANPVQMSSKFIDNVLTLSTNDVEIEGLASVPDFSTKTEKKSFKIPDNLSMCQVPVILPLFGDHDIVQGHISDDEVLQSIKNYHPVVKIWAESVHYQSNCTDNFQLTFKSIASKMINLAKSGSFICSPEIMLKSDSTLFERLHKVRNANMESHYKRFPE